MLKRKKYFSSSLPKYFTLKDITLLSYNLKDLWTIDFYYGHFIFSSDNLNNQNLSVKLISEKAEIVLNQRVEILSKRNPSRPDPG